MTRSPWSLLFLHRLSDMGNKEESSFVWRTVVETANWQQALLLLPALPSAPRHSICSRLLSRLARRSHWQAAQTFFYALPELGISYTPGIYSALLSCYAQRYFWQRSLHLLDLAQSRTLGESKKLDTAVYNTVITSCARASKWQWSVCLLAGLQTGAYGARCKANLSSFNACLNAFGRRGLWTHALALLQGMRTDGVAPDTASLNCTLSACEKGERWQTALVLLPHFSQCERTVVTIGAVVAACVVGSAWEAAIASMAEAFEVGLSPNDEILNSLTESCRRSWAWQQCLSLLKLGHEQGLDSKIRRLAAQHAMNFGQNPVGDRLQIGELATSVALQQSQISIEKFEWMGRQPTVVVSQEWLSEANDLGAHFVRHSLETCSGFGEPGRSETGRFRAARIPHQRWLAPGCHCDHAQNMLELCQNMG